MRSTLAVLAAIMVSLSAPAIAHDGHGSAPDAPAKPQAKVETLLQQALDPRFTADRDVLVDVVEIPPGAVLDRHWHPGEEFHYYLEGEVILEREGMPTVHGKPGMTAHVPYRIWHRASGGPQGGKVLVFRVHEHGEPWRYREGEKSPEDFSDATTRSESPTSSR